MKYNYSNISFHKMSCRFQEKDNYWKMKPIKINNTLLNWKELIMLCSKSTEIYSYNYSKQIKIDKGQTNINEKLMISNLK